MKMPDVAFLQAVLTLMKKNGREHLPLIKAMMR